MTGEATLSNEKNYTVFRFGNHVIRFAAPYSFDRYIEVKEWDKGYLVMMAQYKQNQEPEEADKRLQFSRQEAEKLMK